MGTYCVPLIADLFLFCCERDFMKCLSLENQADIIEASNSISRYMMIYKILITLITFTLNKWLTGYTLLIRFARASSNVSDFNCPKKSPNCQAP